MLVAAAWAISYAAVEQALVDLKPSNELEMVRHWTLYSTSSVNAYMTLLFAKTSVGFFILRMLSPTMNGYRWFVGSTLVLLQIVTWLRLISAFYSTCTEEPLAVPVFTGCFEYRWSFGFAQLWNFYGIFIDSSYSIIPVMIISKLNLNRSKKIALCMLVGLGWIAVVFTLIRAASPYKENLTKAVPLATSMESVLVMICGSLVTLTPLYMSWTEGVPLEPRNHRPGRIGETQQPMMYKESISTMGSGPGSQQHGHPDAPISGIRVEREFNVSSSHDGSYLV